MFSQILHIVSAAVVRELIDTEIGILADMLYDYTMEPALLNDIQEYAKQQQIKTDLYVLENLRNAYL